GASDAAAIAAAEEIAPSEASEAKLKPALRPLIELTPEENAVVDDMVRKGVDFLKNQFDKKVAPKKAPKPQASLAAYQMEAFAVLTLLECGVPPDDPVIQNAAEHIRNVLP